MRNWIADRFLGAKKTEDVFGAGPYRNGSLAPQKRKPINWKNVKEFCLSGLITFIVPIGGGFLAAYPSHAAWVDAPLPQDIANSECRSFCRENDFNFWQARVDGTELRGAPPGYYTCDCVQTSTHVRHHFLCTEENVCIYR